MFEIIIAYFFVLGFIILMIQCIVFYLEDKWCYLSNISKNYFLTISHIRFLINKESLYVEKEVFNNVLNIRDSLNTKILFIVCLFSLVGTLYILFQTIREYSIAKVEIMTNENKCS